MGVATTLLFGGAQCMDEVRREAPIPTRASKANVWAFAENVARHLGYEPGEPLEPLVAKLGGSVEYHTPATFRGVAPESMLVDSKNRFVIFLPTSSSWERDRFTIAHEIGHLFLHYPMVQKQYPNARMRATRWVDDEDPIQQRAEWEANWFAAAFLMPSEAFRKAWTNLNFSIDRVALKFAVSVPAAEIRKSSLGIR